MRSRKYLAWPMLVVMAAMCDGRAEEGGEGGPAAGVMPVPQGQDDYLKADPSAGEMTVNTQAGPVPLKTLTKGKRAAVHFWATWCESCVRELPSFAALAQAKAEKEGEAAPVFLAVALEKKAAAELAAFLKAHQAGNLHVYWADLPEAMRLFRLKGVPTTVALDAQGLEGWRAEGERDWRLDGAAARDVSGGGLDAVPSPAVK